MLAPMEQAQRQQPVAEDLFFAKDVVLQTTEFGSDEIYPSNGNKQSEADTYTVMSDTIWSSLYPSLHSLARYLVHSSPLPCWRGQENDLADDIVQETIRRVIERAEKAKRGEAPPIQSLKQMANTVAYNYYRDLKRHDYRVSRQNTTTHSTHFYPVDAHSNEYLLDAVSDKVDQDSLFAMLANEIGRFPTKQKQAILIDLANRMYFDGEPTSLQESFLDIGIELRHYRQPLPDDRRERVRHISLCSQAYKRVAHLPCAQQYV